MLKISQKNNILKNKNIILTNNLNEADLLIYLINSSTNLINASEEDKIMLKESNIPVIILERLDSSISWFREFDMIPNLKGIIKNRLIEPIDYMNSEYYYGRYHYRLMYNSFIINNNINIKEKDLSNSFYAGLQKLPLISNDNLKKFHHTLWDIKSSPLGGPCKNLRKFTINYNDKRYYDIFCVNREKKVFKVGEEKKQKI